MNFDLTEIKKRFQPQSALALTIESAQIVVSLARLGFPQSGPSIALPVGSEELVKSPDRVGKELAAALQGAGIRERRAVVCIPAGWALTTSADLPEVNQEDLRGYFELRAEGEFSMAVSELRLAHSPYSLADGSKRATLAAVPAKKLAALEAMLAAAGCRALSISLALDGCYSNPSTPLHFLIQTNRVDVVVSAGAGIAALRSLPNPLVAEEGEPDRLGPMVREIRITLGRLPDSLRQSVKLASFCGSAAATHALRIKLQQDLQRMGIQCAADRAPSNPAMESADRLLREQPMDFEFIAAEVNPWSAKIERFNTRRGRQIGLAALALILIPFLLFMVRSHRESSLEAEWKAMDKSVADVTAEQQKMRQFRPWFDPAPHSLRILDRLIEAFPDSGDVWSKSVQIEGGSKVTCAGFARSETARTSLLTRLRKQPEVAGLKTLQVRGENPIQFSITYTWESGDE